MFSFSIPRIEQISCMRWERRLAPRSERSASGTPNIGTISSQSFCLVRHISLATSSACPERQQRACSHARYGVDPLCQLQSSERVARRVLVEEEACVGDLRQSLLHSLDRTKGYRCAFQRFNSELYSLRQEKCPPCVPPWVSRSSCSR